MAKKILTETKNPFLQRQELVLEMTSQAAPTQAEAIEAVGKGEDVTVISRINTSFGKNTFTIEAKVYDTAEAREQVEVIPQKIRKKMEAEKKAAEEAAAKAEEEAKAKAEEAAETPKEEAAEEVSEEKTEEVKETTEEKTE